MKKIIKITIALLLVAFIPLRAQISPVKDRVRLIEPDSLFKESSTNSDLLFNKSVSTEEFRKKWIERMHQTSAKASAKTLKKAHEEYNNLFAGGTGTEENPWLIETADQLNNVRLFLGEENADKFFKLNSNIYLDSALWNDGDGWIPIGNMNTPFTGQFNGNNYVISGIKINRSSISFQGLFGYIKESTIANLGLIDVNITGGDNVGAIAGRIDFSVILNSYVLGVVSGNSFVGGMVGHNYRSIILQSYNLSYVHGNTMIVGGIVGQSSEADSYIFNCYNRGKVNGNGIVGGLVGLNGTKSVINKCYSTGSVDATSNVGGLVGINNGTVRFSFWDIESSRQNISAGGTGKTTDKMKTLNTYTPEFWDFKGIGIEGVWNKSVNINDNYPFLNWEYPGEPPTTEFVVPTIITDKVTNTSMLKAEVEVIITNVGNPNISQYGVCWNLTGAPTIDDNVSEEGSLTKAGHYITTITNLDPSTDYYARAYAINDIGTTYGDVIKFSTHIIEAIEPNGSGTEENPYLVNDLHNLYWIAVDSERWNKYYIQNDNIDASITSTWEDGGWPSIGSVSPFFTGYYNGNNFTINKLYINRPDKSHQGLFGLTKNANISNINLIDVNVNADRYIGALIGHSYQSIITNCHGSGLVYGNWFWAITGGLIGFVEDYSVLKNCSFTGFVNTSYTGFLDAPAYLGGLAGIVDRSSSISNSFSNAVVNGVASRVGGLAGYLGEYCTINNSYSLGYVSAVGESLYVGGLVGLTWYSDIQNSYSSAIVNSGGAMHVGGLVGLNFGNVVTCFWDIDISGQSSGFGLEGGNLATGLTTSEMNSLSNFTKACWDFKGLSDDGIWNIKDYRNNGYPYLSWQYPDDPGPVAPPDYPHGCGLPPPDPNTDVLYTELSQGINIYPNPASSAIHIESDFLINKIIISNIGGNITYNEHIDSKNAKISTDSFNNGVYFIQIHTNSKVIFRKVVILN